MCRIILLLKRKGDLTHDQFREHYETKHRPRAEKLINGFCISYERHYLYSINPNDAPPIYDAVTQICYPDRETYERCAAAYQTQPRGRKRHRRG